MMRVVEVSKADWAGFSENAHRAVFGAIKPLSFDRIDYALLGISDDDEVIGYITVRELDHETVYWQFGGTVVPKRGLALTGRGYKACLDYQAKKSKRMVTYIENTNYPMLRLALSHGLVIIGVRNAFGSVLVELAKDFTHGNDAIIRQHD